MARAKQLTLSEENRSERLAHIAPLLWMGKSTTMPVSPPPRKRGADPSHRGQPRQRHKSVCEGGLRYNEADVLEVELPNTPGAQAKSESKFADKNINITALEKGCRHSLADSLVATQRVHCVSERSYFQPS
jgi:hypothetical protein